MSILIFGGSGFVGKNLAKELQSNGYPITIVTRNPQKVVNSFGNQINIMEWDYSSPLTSTLDLQPIKAVINLAGESIGNRRWTNAVKKEIYESRIRTTQEIVRAINKGILQPEVLINASAVGYYGLREDEEITEIEKEGRDFLAQVCSDWEKEAYQVQNELTRVVTLRLGVVLGHEGALQRMALPFKFYLGGPMGTGEQWLSWIHIQDLSSMLRYIIEHPKLSGPINAVAPKPLKMREFSKILGQVLKSPSWLPVPEIALRAALGQMAEMLLHGQRVVPEKILKTDFEFRYPDLRAALKDIFV